VSGLPLDGQALASIVAAQTCLILVDAHQRNVDCELTETKQLLHQNLQGVLKAFGFSTMHRDEDAD
jgi:hypothetical protein